MLDGGDPYSWMTAAAVGGAVLPVVGGALALGRMVGGYVNGRVGEGGDFARRNELRNAYGEDEMFGEYWMPPV